MTKQLTVYLLTGVLSFGTCTAAASASEVTDWNEMMLRAGQIGGTSPLAMTRVAAIVQSAVFDAVNGIERRYTPIHVAPAGPASASRRAAAMQAAYVALSKLYPAQQATFDARRAISLTILNATESAASVADGIAWGESVANQIWAWRLTDGIANTTPSWPGNTALGQWRPTPNAPAPGTSTNGAGYPQFFNMTTWAIAAASQFRPPAPPSLSSAKYAKDFNEVKVMGSQSSATRTPDQTVAAMLWNSSTASNLWNLVALSLLDGRGKHGDDDGDDNWHGDNSHGKDRRDTLLDHAKVLGEMDVAMADAAIVCWDAKYTYNFWRPITAIRELADDGNAATTPDAGWTPLLVTPAHPSYTSGHSCVSSAAATVLAKEFGEHTHFTVESDTMMGVTRSFRRFSSALEEVKNARIFGGIHFRFDCDFGQAAGAAAAEYVLQHAFQRVH